MQCWGKKEEELVEEEEECEVFVAARGCYHEYAVD